MCSSHRFTRNSTSWMTFSTVPPLCRAVVTSLALAIVDALCRRWKLALNRSSSWLFAAFRAVSLSAERLSRDPPPKDSPASELVPHADPVMPVVDGLLRLLVGVPDRLQLG